MEQADQDNQKKIKKLEETIRWEIDECVGYKESVRWEIDGCRI
jgi:hypothetical protein